MGLVESARGRWGLLKVQGKMGLVEGEKGRWGLLKVQGENGAC
jgi:hypothetical protein